MGHKYANFSQMVVRLWVSFADTGWEYFLSRIVKLLSDCILISVLFVIVNPLVQKTMPRGYRLTQNIPTNYFN
jgi:hypothetical protein